MTMLNERVDECVATLDRERMAIEIIFRLKENGEDYLFWIEVSATLENEAIATVENEATQTDWMGDLGGGLGVDQAARRGRGSAAAGRAAAGDRAVDGRPCAGV
jgi:hypothetical protein